MSLPKVLCFHLILMLSAFTGAANGYYYSRWAKCIFSSSDLSDMVFVDNYIFNKDVYIQFNSTVGEYVGYTAHGVYNAELWNKDPNQLQQERADVDRYCKHNAEIYYSAILNKAGKWHKIQISPVTHETLVLNVYTRYFYTTV
ncbi:H-2 class II histocompatibility antigen, A beta chain-like [Sinocyclocheilus anshuiensis]|uniref:H-2 class II histocompatibility antigen, A beta chain-like n=1 Tax=Sinocyclocheilus anshuiensis TaxID=1608454 RepID=UPI0007B9311C|nr:PREDICTED: H-2 class II histocompatibility antigen, A beta chain-like [Sinocyclocheilus anshuiensis]